MKICLVYDRFPPHTVGGVERWMRDLAVRLSEAGHDVTYLTARRWDEGAEPKLSGVEVIGLVRTPKDYTEDRRALSEPLIFGAAVLIHLLRHGRRYDVIHLASFPYFPLLAAGMLRRRLRYRLVVDWHEVWTRAYWRSYAGPLVGTFGWLVQRACVAIPQRAFCVSSMHVERLRAEGFQGRVALLPGMYDGPVTATPHKDVESIIVYAGRHVREKRIPNLIRAFALVQKHRPGLRLELFGDGPERKRLEQLAANLGLKDHVSFRGTCTEQEVAAALARAACLATASEREGYGLVVVEAAARGTPSVVVSGPENAATELVGEGVNGAIAASGDPSVFAAAILRVLDGGPILRASTARWFTENAGRLRIENSFAEVVASYTV